MSIKRPRSEGRVSLSSPFVASGCSKACVVVSEIRTQAAAAASLVKRFDKILVRAGLIITCRAVEQAEDDSGKSEMVKKAFGLFFDVFRGREGAH